MSDIILKEDKVVCHLDIELEYQNESQMMEAIRNIKDIKALMPDSKSVSEDAENC